MAFHHVTDRRRVLAAIAALALPAVAFAQADAFPNKPITLVVGSAPGGSNDTFARAVGKRLQDALGQPVVVDNKPAGGGVIANATVARAAADGYTLVVLSSTFTTGAAIRTNLTYDAIKDFKPVAMLAKGPMLVTVNKDSRFKTIQDLVAAAKASPGKLNYGTSGAGSINHFATELFTAAAGIKMTHVPYKGMGPATTDLLGGQIDVLVASAPSILTQVRGGNARALALTTATRSQVAPDIPSLEESGYKGSAVDLWWGVLAPANTPQAVVDKLNAEINKQIQSSEMKAFFIKEGAEPAPMKPQQFADFIAAEIARWKKVAKAADIRPE
ncbi:MULTISPECIES: Bug family tripartite tricarboxylate transporter substrate binding protein [unclassified Variovorax]|uniref:Bug family tripartite tricarboxylate transporter substrate binding protein n=1 Tax=unclassified Variovorax TaxID=663243 RepID=UPI0013195EBE|nr:MULTISPECIES: tripartite tricarboxylate transporter substrate binding protein [unclassified Variovorax]VTU24547.1 Argininosuccinate lyase [Variovorax sp. SRS16]VTU32710.1 Argininosuccinate lyase [Variovorax sp. PBL-E5]